MKCLLKLSMSGVLLLLLLLCQRTTSSTAATTSDTTDESTSDPGDVFPHFIAHNKTRTCTADEHARPFNNMIRGVNLGGWMVLEPWITPSLFYQFLDNDENHTAMDIFTFCKVLGPEEANKQLRRHWETWVTEDIINDLAASGAVNSLRLPVGDFMFKPYGPYVGCVDGSLDYVDRLLDWANATGLSVLLDIHAMRDSQNGFDNSGQTMGFQWTSALNTEPAGLVTFQHWPLRTARWMGEFDLETTSYTMINRTNIKHSLEVIEILVDTYKGHPAVLGLEPVNEPWQYTPLEELKQFYWEAYLIVKRRAPYWKYIMHDSFRFSADVWGGFMKGCPDRALDTHIYQAWMDPSSRVDFYADACQEKRRIAEMERAFGPVVVGEWSLATDNCAMWLNGWNDNLPGFPRLPCKYIPCSPPYMGEEQPGTPVDASKALQGPYGTGMSGPIFGLCPTNRDWLVESSGNPKTGKDWVTAPPEAPHGRDDSDDVMMQLAAKKINAFSGIGHGFYFWNFRTDLYHPHWSYMQALDRGWIPRGNLQDNKILTACDREDMGEFRCYVSPNAPEKAIRNGVKYAVNAEGKESSYVDGLSGTQLRKEADKILGQYWQDHHSEGVTCDFGGIAFLIELDRRITDDDKNFMDDDEYVVYQRSGMSVATLIGVFFLVACFSGLFGFVIAMRVNRGFNAKVQKSKYFKPIGNSRNSLIRSSLRLDQLDAGGYTEVPQTQMSYGAASHRR